MYCWQLQQKLASNLIVLSLAQLSPSLFNLRWFWQYEIFETNLAQLTLIRWQCPHIITGRKWLHILPDLFTDGASVEKIVTALIYKVQQILSILLNIDKHLAKLQNIELLFDTDSYITQLFKSIKSKVYILNFAMKTLVLSQSHCHCY